VSVFSNVQACVSLALGEYQLLGREAVRGVARAATNAAPGADVLDVGCLSVPPAMLGFSQLRRDERFRLVQETIEKTPMAEGSSGSGLFKRVKMDDRESADWREEACMVCISSLLFSLVLMIGVQFCCSDHPVQPILLACACRFRAYSQVSRGRRLSSLPHG
jgi:hypothetical protein